jgi:predicted nucleic acid-binding protein
MELRPKLVYLDVCALGRPYDNQEMMRIRLEATAVQLVVVHVRLGNYELCYSPVHVREIGDNPDVIARADLLALLSRIGTDIRPRIDVGALVARTRELTAGGFGVADAFHVAHAEQVKASFVSCDDRLIRKCRAARVGVWVGTPVEFCAEEGLL